MTPRGSRERAFFVTEQFGLDELRRNRRAIKRDERPLVPLRFFVNGPRHEFFSRTRFAENAHSRLAARYSINLRN